MNHPTCPTTRKLIVLGSTGSIGVNTLDVVKHLNANGSPIEIVGLAAGKNIELLAKQAHAFNVKTLAIADPSLATSLAQRCPNMLIFSGEDASLKLIEELDADTVITAVVGSAGLPATLRAAEKSMKIGLANKETLVAAGELVTPAIKRHNATLIPVDSEHSAIFQCLQGQSHKAIKRIVLTASGGPFRQTPKAQMDQASVEEALNHPTWSMGAKITIDSASMMNKALEIIEAHWLFDLPAEKIDVIIHPQSIVHSFVEYEDHSILAQLGPPDMRTPIQYALTYPKRLAGCSDAMDWFSLKSLTFESPDHDRFGSLKLAYRVIQEGGTSGAIFNAANEVAVACFLAKQIRFGQITQLVTQAMDAINAVPVDCLETAMQADRDARNFVMQALATHV